MIIKILVENLKSSEELTCEHGLSMYIEFKDKKILFDAGKTDAFYENAQKLDVHIEDVDYMVLSHGHYDHGGGLATFLKYNKKAKLYARPEAFEVHNSIDNDSIRYIGIDRTLKENPRFILTKDKYIIDDGIELFSNIPQIEKRAKSNEGLMAETNGENHDDSFIHEQNLVLKKNGEYVLITGCSHNGIINILKEFKNIYGVIPDYVLGGFHLYGASETKENIDNIALNLLDMGPKCYTGHCTGIEPYNRLKNIMGDNINYMSTGSIIKI